MKLLAANHLGGAALAFKDGLAAGDGFEESEVL